MAELGSIRPAVLRSDAPADRIRPVILGILNVTPDSFSDGGEHPDASSAIDFAVHLFESGADIIDVGGESTRPGAERLPIEEEQRRVVPVLEELAKLGIPVSIDTLNARMAVVATRLGAVVVNDVSGGTADPDMPRVAADSGAMFVAMHSRGSSATMASLASYGNVVTDVRFELERRIDALTAHGVHPERIIVDPGLGFAKNTQQNWQLLGALADLRKLGHPVLVGASRKRFLADLLPHDVQPAGRDAATAVISALAAEAGVWGVRVHDVASTKAALDVWSAMNRGGTVSSSPPDQLTLTGLRASGFHGVYGFERANGQEFVIDLTVWLDLAKAASSDDLGRTIDYGVLAGEVVAAVERDPVDLIETVAERVAAVALGHRAAQSVTVTVHKPSAPIQVPFADVAVTITRARA